MRTYIAGHTKDTFCITRGDRQEVIECKDSIVKLWLSSGTILGMKYGNMLDPNIWKIRILHGPVDNRYMYKSCFNTGAFDVEWDTDTFETEEEVVNIKIIPRSYYEGVSI